MNCISPPELDDGQLLSYVDGEADDPIAAHIVQCSYCRERAYQLSHLQNRLRARLYRLTCPPPLELGDYHLGLLAPSQAVTVAQHLRECPHCAREVAQLRDYLRELAPEPGPLEPVKTLIARLVGGRGADQGHGELAPAPAFAGLRGNARGPITLEANGLLIVLDVQPATEGRVTLLGQIAAEDQDHWTGALVELHQASALQMTATVDDLGAFRCEGILPRPTELRIVPTRGPIVLVSYVEIA